MTLEPLKWKAQKGMLAECLDVDARRIDLIEIEVKDRIRDGQNMIELIEDMRQLCLSEEEFTAFIFSLGHYQGTCMPFGFKIT